jgi:hypothetical protein
MPIGSGAGQPPPGQDQIPSVFGNVASRPSSIKVKAAKRTGEILLKPCLALLANQRFHVRKLSDIQWHEALQDDAATWSSFKRGRGLGEDASIKCRPSLLRADLKSCKRRASQRGVPSVWPRRRLRITLSDYAARLRFVRVVPAVLRQQLTCITGEELGAQQLENSASATPKGQMLSSHGKVTTMTEAHKSARGGSSPTETRTSRPNDTMPDTHSGRDSRAQAIDPGSRKHAQTPHQTEGSNTRLQISKRSAPQHPSDSDLGQQTHTPTVAGSMSVNLKSSTVKEGLLTKSDAPSSGKDSGKQALPSHPGGEADSQDWKDQSPHTDTRLRQAGSLSNESAEKVQSFVGSQRCVQPLSAAAGSGKDDFKPAKATCLHESTSAKEGNVDARGVRSTIPHPTVKSISKPEPTCQRSLQNCYPPSQPPIDSTTGSKLSGVEVLLSSVNGKLDYRVQRRNAELPQCGESGGTTGANVEADKVEDSQYSASGEANEANVDTHTLGEQVISIRRIKAERQRLAQDMKDLDTRRRDAEVCIEASIAQMDEDIREHVRLSSVLEKLQSLIVERKRELTVVLHRVDNHTDTLDRIKTEYETCEQAIKQMEAEFCSSGKQLQGIVQKLGIFS